MQILEACKKANCDEFIKKFQKGIKNYWDKVVKLSGGQKTKNSYRQSQKNSPFLLLDEATSSLDSRSEKKFKLHYQIL